MSLTIPADYGYVMGAALLTAVLNEALIINTSLHRNKAKVPFPNAYATAAESKDDRAKYLFNCAQRAHQNFLEHWPQMLFGLFAGGVKYPVINAWMGGFWVACRALYAIGYMDKTKTKGERRWIGNFFHLPEYGLLITTGMTAYSMLSG